MASDMYRALRVLLDTFREVANLSGDNHVVQTHRVQDERSLVEHKITSHMSAWPSL